MSDFGTRSKINSKIIFNDFNTNLTKNVLIIGVNNSDILEILKIKGINFSELETTDESEIIGHLEKIESDKFDSIIINLEFTEFKNMKNILKLITDKSKFSLIRFRTKTSKSGRRSRKKEICTLLKYKNIIVFKKFYCKKNFMSENPLFQLFTYYNVFYISKNEPGFITEVNFIDRIKKFFSGKTQLNLTIEKNK